MQCNDSPFLMSQHMQYCTKSMGYTSTLMVVDNSIMKEKKFAEEGGIARIPREGDRLIIGNQEKMDEVCMRG